jgi:hypothetical protein
MVVVKVVHRHFLLHYIHFLLFVIERVWVVEVDLERVAPA